MDYDTMYVLKGVETGGREKTPSFSLYAQKKTTRKIKDRGDEIVIPTI